MVRQVLVSRWWLLLIRSGRFRLGWTKFGCELEQSWRLLRSVNTWIWSIGVQAA